MALVDYKLCDLCGSKCFYDAEIGDPRYVATYDLEEAEETDPISIVTLCADCSKTHEIIIQKRGDPK